MLTLLLALLAPRAEAAEPYTGRWSDRWDQMDPRPPNLVSIEATILGDFAGVSFGYRRGLGRHFSVGALFEYAYPNPGYGHLVGFGHTLEVTGWIRRPWSGLFVATTLTVGHQFVHGLARLHTVALGGGASLGWGWDLTAHINLALSGGLRRVGVIERSSQICTVPGQCIFTAEGFEPRFALTFAYRF